MILTTINVQLTFWGASLLPCYYVYSWCTTSFHSISFFCFGI